jgi:uncharacterized protein YqeY
MKKDKTIRAALTKITIDAIRNELTNNEILNIYKRIYETQGNHIDPPLSTYSNPCKTLLADCIANELRSPPMHNKQLHEVMQSVMKATDESANFNIKTRGQSLKTERLRCGCILCCALDEALQQ